MKTNVKITIGKDRILKAAEEVPESKELLKSLFPEAFIDNTVFCKIGSVLESRRYKTNQYAVLNIDGNIEFINLSYSHFWEASKRLKASNLYRPYDGTITVSEFETLIGKGRAEEFYVVLPQEK